MSDEEKALLAAIRKREAAATEGPWENVETYDGPTVMTKAFMPAYKGEVDQTPKRRIITTVHSLQRRDPVEWWPLDADAEFIARARSDVPFLLSLIERLGVR